MSYLILMNFMQYDLVHLLETWDYEITYQLVVQNTVPDCNCKLLQLWQYT